MVLKKIKTYILKTFWLKGGSSKKNLAPIKMWVKKIIFLTWPPQSGWAWSKSGLPKKLFRHYTLMIFLASLLSKSCQCPCLKTLNSCAKLHHCIVFYLFSKCIENCIYDKAAIFMWIASKDSNLIRLKERNLTYIYATDAIRPLISIYLKVALDVNQIITNILFQQIFNASCTPSTTTTIIVSGPMTGQPLIPAWWLVDYRG